MIYGIIYKYISPSNKIYIGQTINSIEKRKNQHINNANNGSTTIFHNAIRKYGIENFKYEVIQEAYSKEELNELEIYYINFYNSYYKNKKGYNMTIGGEGANGYDFTEDDKKKLSLSLKEYYKNNPESLVKMSNRAKEYHKNNPEKAEKHSNFMKGFSNLEENKNISIKTFSIFRKENPEYYSIQQKEIWGRDGYKEKMSESQKNYLNNNPEEKIIRTNRLIEYSKNNKELHSKIMKDISNILEKKEKFKEIIKNDKDSFPEKYKEANEKRKKTMNTKDFKQNMSIIKRKILPKFSVFDKDNNLIGEFDNTIDCINKLKLHKPPSIVLCLNKKINQSCGFKFKYNQ